MKDIKYDFLVCLGLTDDFEEVLILNEELDCSTSVEKLHNFMLDGRGEDVLEARLNF